MPPKTFAFDRRAGFADFYRENGFVIINDVYSKDDIAALTKACDELSARRRADGKNPHSPHLKLHTHDPVFGAAARHPRMLDVVRDILGGGPMQLIHTQLTYKPPGSPGFSVHQDNYYNRVDPPEAISTCCLFIDHADDRNGALNVYPGSHREPLLPPRKDWGYFLTVAPGLAVSMAKRAAGIKPGPNDNTDGVIERLFHTPVPPQYRRVVAEVAAGGVCVMHPLLVHGSGTNSTSDQMRRSVAINLIRKGQPFRKGLFADRELYDV